MVIAPFLAMTETEIRANPDISFPMGWMACHFSPYGTGISNLPEHLPPNSLLILDDQIPWCGHDPNLIVTQLEERLDALSCHGLLLDLQRPNVPEVAELAGFLTRQLRCPVVVTEGYAKDLSCPVFLPPVPLQQTVPEHLVPWQGREIWLEVALDCETVTLTAQGAATAPQSWWERPTGGHADGDLHCHYHVQTQEDRAIFTLHRTKKDLESLLEEAVNYGVTAAVGLWQKLA